MPNMVKVRDKVAKKILTRNTVDARELVGRDPERFSFHGEKALALRLTPIVHKRPPPPLEDPDDTGADEPAAKKKAA